MIENRLHSCESLDEAWSAWFDDIISDEVDIDSRDGKVVGEVINAVTVISDPTKNIMKNPIRNLPMRYCVGELLWYLSGNPSLDAIRLYTNAWDRMSDNGKTVNSNYGDRIQHIKDEVSGAEFDQMKMIENILKHDPESRQAVIHLKQARDVYTFPSKDVNCGVCVQFLIRENKLYATAYMRSNDLWLGFPNDVFQFTCMQIYLAMRLGVRLGTYTHVAGSLHLYERDYNKAKERMKNEN